MPIGLSRTWGAPKTGALQHGGNLTEEIWANTIFMVVLFHGYFCSEQSHKSSSRWTRGSAWITLGTPIMKTIDE